MRESVVEFQVLHAAKVATLVLAASASAGKLACAACFAACGHTGTLRMPSHMCRQPIVLKEEVRSRQPDLKGAPEWDVQPQGVAKGRF